MAREQFTFYRSYWEAAKLIKKPADRLSLLEAIAAYALDEEERKLTDVAAPNFLLIKPTLDSSAKKAKAGCAGGSRKQTGREKENEVEDEVEIEVEDENECSNSSPSGEEAGAHARNSTAASSLRSDETLSKLCKTYQEHGWTMSDAMLDYLHRHPEERIHEK